MGVTNGPRGLARSKLDVLPEAQRIVETIASQMLAATAQMQRNVEFSLAHYLRAVTGYRPEIATLVTSSTRVVALSGDHGGFSIHPDSFAAMLHKVLVAG